MILILVLLQVSNKNAELLENRLKVLKYQCHYARLKLLFPMKKKHGNVFRFFSVFNELT